VDGVSLEHIIAFDGFMIYIYVQQF
jgi:hypothetical protein